jgi:hypothetical protein
VDYEEDVSDPGVLINLQLGDIIKIKSYSNEKLNGKTFFIEYIDPTKIKLINIDTFIKTELRIQPDKKIVDEMIQNQTLQFETFIGLKDVPGPHGLVKNTHEGIICSVIKDKKVITPSQNVYPRYINNISLPTRRLRRFWFRVIATSVAAFSCRLTMTAVEVRHKQGQ